jgi:hypothetical protein
MMTLDDKIHHTKEIANAIQRREEFYTLEIFMGENHPLGYSPQTSELKHIELPTPQVAGTMTQQRTYAMDKAMDIIEQIDRS